MSISFNGQYAVKFLDKVYANATVKLNRKFQLYKIIKTWTPGQGTPSRPRKIRKDKGTVKGPRVLTKQGSLNIANFNISKAKISMQQAKEIKDLYATGDFSNKELAKKYSVSAATIYNILNNKREMDQC